ncbi:TMV resistance protein [Nymphaea thermarum]|nr:TMV resistance protein [Nymphaea thermarum]
MTIFDKVSHEFRYTSFISDIREEAKKHNGICLLQAKLISDISKETSVVIDTVNNGISAIRQKFGCKKVLIVLDDIDDTEQLDALVGDQNYPKELKYPRSLKLFCLHAFKVSPPTSEFFGLSEKVAKVAGGLPLALKVFGSHFSSINRVREIWEVELGKLQRHSHQKVVERLKISYDRLELTQKYVFLDVACFLIASSKEEALFFWEDHYAADSEINALESKSLLTMDVDNRFRMHGRIQDMGRWIVKEAGNLKCSHVQQTLGLG